MVGFLYFMGVLSIVFGVLAIVSIEYAEAGVILVSSGILTMALARGLDDLRAVRTLLERADARATPKPAPVEAHPIAQS